MPMFPTDFGLLQKVPPADDSSKSLPVPEEIFTNVVGQTGVGKCVVTTWCLASDEQRGFAKKFSGLELNDVLAKSGAQLRNRVLDGEGVFPAHEERMNGVLRNFRYVDHNGRDESPALGLPSYVTLDESGNKKNILVFFFQGQHLVDPAPGIPAYMRFDQDSGVLAEAKDAQGSLSQEKLDALKGIVRMPNMIDTRCPVFDSLPESRHEIGKTVHQIAKESGNARLALALQSGTANRPPAPLTDSFTQSSGKPPRQTGRFIRGITRFLNSDTREVKERWATQDLNAEMASKSPNEDTMRLHIEAGAQVTVRTLEFAAVHGFERVVDQCLVRLDDFGNAALLAKGKGHDAIVEQIAAVVEERRALGIDDTMLRAMKSNPAQAQKL